MRFSCTLGLALMLGISPIEMVAQHGPSDPVRSANAAQRAVERVRAVYYAQDFEGGYHEGVVLVRQHPSQPELRAWLIANQAWSGMEDEAVLAADSLLAADPESPWGLFAKALALNRTRSGAHEALPLAQEALARVPGHPDVLWLNSRLLAWSGKPEEAIMFADSAIANAGPSPMILVEKARALVSQSFSSRDRKGDPTRLEEAITAIEQARRLYPDDIGVLQYAASLLFRQRRPAEAYALLRRAVELGSYSSTIRSSYWSAVLGLQDRTSQEKRAEILRDLEELLLSRGGYPGTLYAAARMLGELDLLDRRREIEERILRDHPGSVEAERVFVDRYRALARSIREKEVSDSAQAEQEYLRQLRAFINRPRHRDKELLGSAYRALFDQIRADSTASTDELLRVIEGMADYNDATPHLAHVEGPIALAERKAHFRAAERIARKGIKSAKDLVANGNYHYESIAEYANWIDWMKASAHDALGWVYFHEGRLTDAEVELKRAHELAPRYVRILYHLGRLAEVRGQVDVAEETYVRGYVPRKPGDREKEGTHDALERLYQAKYGTLDGFDAYLEVVRERERERRRQSIAELRIAEPEPMPAFVLERLSGNKISSASLEGKIVVINFWGTWCGPCVAEAPDVQKLHERYKNDPDVRFLTISNDSDPDVLRKFMTERELDFPVLLDDGYVNKAAISVWPTTWFVAPDGRIAFTHKGASSSVLEEFIWRVEILKDEVKSAR